MASLASILGLAPAASAAAGSVYDPMLTPEANAMVGATPPKAATPTAPAPATFQRPKGLRNMVGVIADIFAAMGNRPMGYSGTLATMEDKFAQERKRLAQSAFLNNPTDPDATAAFIREAPQEYMAYVKEMTPKPTNPGSRSPFQVAYDDALAAGATPREAQQAGIEVTLRMRGPQSTSAGLPQGLERGSDGRAVPIPGVLDFYRQRAEAGRAPPAPSGGGGSGGGSVGAGASLSSDDKMARGLDPDLPWIYDAKGVPRLPTGFKAPTGQRGAVAPEEVMGAISAARSTLKQASSGGLSGAVTRGAEMLGVSTDRSKADAQLRVLAGKLTASVPRFEGPQALPEVKLYQAMAADVGNPDLPWETRLAALGTMEQLVRKNAKVKEAKRGGASTGGVVVNGFRFPDQKAADAYKKAAGL